MIGLLPKFEPGDLVKVKNYGRFEAFMYDAEPPHMLYSKEGATAKVVDQSALSYVVEFDAENMSIVRGRMWKWQLEPVGQ